jgi:hypothetical protein
MKKEEQSEVIAKQIKESEQDNHTQTQEDISNILARQRQKEKGFKLK